MVNEKKAKVGAMLKKRCVKKTSPNEGAESEVAANAAAEIEAAGSEADVAGGAAANKTAESTPRAQASASDASTAPKSILRESAANGPRGVTWAD